MSTDTEANIEMKSKQSVSTDAAIIKGLLLSEDILEFMCHNRAFEDKPMVENQLATRFEVSRSCIRDTLKVLENEDFIERRKNKGVYLKKLTPKDLSDLYDLRIAIEGFAVRLACLNATEEDFRNLEEISERFHQACAEKDLDKMESEHIAFHEKIIALSGNKMLLRNFNFIRVTRRVIQYQYAFTSLDRPSPPRYSHDAILKKMRERNAETSERLMRKHIQYGKLGIVEHAIGVKLNMHSGKSSQVGGVRMKNGIKK